MPEYNYSFISLSQSSDLNFKTDDLSGNLNEDFLFLFINQEDIDAENYKINIQSLQQNTQLMRERFDKFINVYKSADVKFYQLRSYLQKLDDDEYFLLWPTDDLTSEKRDALYNYLTSLREEVPFDLLKQQHDNLFKELKSVYTMTGYGEETKRGIGEIDKQKRICRFCRKGSPEVSFKNIAHAISESLGNKKIILYEECDGCNGRFGASSGIENSLISYLKVYGNFFGIKGKSGIPKLKGKNFTLTNEGTIKLDHFLKEGEIPNESEGTSISFKLETYDQIVDQHLYRTLCKFAVSVVDNEVLKHLGKTIQWINGEIDLDRLPKIAILKSYTLFKQHPGIVIYLRRSDDKTLPFMVGEFHYTFFTFVFIIPLVDVDVKDFIDKDDYIRFWNFFKHYQTNSWHFQDFSDSRIRSLVINMNFDINKEK